MARAWWLVFALVLAPSRAQALSGELTATLQLEREALPEDLLYAQLRFPALTTTTSAERTSLFLHVLAEARHRPFDALGLRIGLDSGLLELDLVDSRVLADGRDFGDRAVQTFFLGETSADLQLGDAGIVEVRAGKLRPRIGAGAIFDAYAFGASIDADLTLLENRLPIGAHLDLILPDGTFTSAQKNSPLVALSAGYESSALRVRGLGALYFDGGNGLAPVLSTAYARGRFQAFSANTQKFVDGIAQPRIRQAAQQYRDDLIAEAGSLYNQGAIGYDLTTGGYLGYAGIEAKWRRAPLSVEGAFVWAHGGLDISARPNRAFQDYLASFGSRFVTPEQLIAANSDEGELAIDGLYADLTARLAIFESLEVNGFAIYLSGDRGLRTNDDADRTYDAFVALSPLITHTLIFFNGGIAGSLAAPTVTTPAPDGTGIYGGGLGARSFPTDWLSAELTLASLWSPIGSLDGHHHFGLEADLGLDAALDASWLLSLDAGIFSAGNYFGDQSLGYQLLFGATFGIGSD